MSEHDANEMSDATPIELHDPMSLTHRLEREAREMLARGVDPKDIACAQELERARVYAAGS